MEITDEQLNQIAEKVGSALAAVLTPEPERTKIDWHKWLPTIIAFCGVLGIGLGILQGSNTIIKNGFKNQHLILIETKEVQEVFVKTIDERIKEKGIEADIVKIEIQNDARIMSKIDKQFEKISTNPRDIKKTDIEYLLDVWQNIKYKKQSYNIKMNILQKYYNDNFKGGMGND